jgi:hypothetical protein
MSTPFPRRTAAELMDSTFLARWADRDRRGQPVTVRTVCRHCAEPFELGVTPEGPVGDSRVMAWVGERDDLRGKACTGL